MKASLILLAFLAIFGSGPLEAQAPTPGCDETSAHEPDQNGQPGAPHAQHIGNPNADDQCHGENGDRGSCGIGNDETDDVGVKCVVEIFSGRSFGCTGFANCGGPGQTVSCGGGAGWSAFAGIDSTTGQGYAICQKGNTTTAFACP